MKKLYLKNDSEFIILHRLIPYLALELVNILSNQITVQRISAIPVHLQVLAVLRFLAEGAFQKGVASDFNHPMSQASLSRCIDRVVYAIIELKNNFLPSGRKAATFWPLRETKLPLSGTTEQKNSIQTMASKKESLRSHVCNLGFASADNYM